MEREPSSTQPISKLEFEFERRKLTKDDVRELIYREVCQYILMLVYVAKWLLLFMMAILNFVFESNRF